MLRSSLAALPSEHGSLNLHSDLAPRFIVWKKFWVSKCCGKSSINIIVILDVTGGGGDLIYAYTCAILSRHHGSIPALNALLPSTMNYKFLSERLIR